MSRLPSAILVTVLVATSSAVHANSSVLARVRAIDTGADRLVQEAAARSQTFRQLVAALQTSNVIVYVAESEDLRSDVRGALRFMGSGAGDERYLRIDVRRGDLASTVSLRRAIATLAHELMHAIEIASASHVVDHATFVDFYKTTADELREDVFDTRAAIEMGERVYFEMTGRRR
jgi:adenylosuccinate synthase